MSLTAEQIAIRAHGLGASEAAAVLELSPYQQPIDVYLRKRGLAEEWTGNGATEVGDALEDSLRALYTARTGRRMDRVGLTLVHPEHPEILASPDGLSPDEDAGLEIKVVGLRMAHHWGEEGLDVPDYVDVQARQCMAVTGRSAWDVGRLIGTDFAVVRIERDLELEEEMLAALCAWWADHIVANIPPAASDPDAKRRWLRTRYPGSSRTACVQSSDPAVAEALRWLAYAKQVQADAERAEKQIQNALGELIGDEYGIEVPLVGKLLWAPRRGSTSYKGIAEELSGGAIPEAMIEKHRGAPGRTFGLHMAKTKAPKGTSK